MPRRGATSPRPPRPLRGAAAALLGVALLAAPLARPAPARAPAAVQDPSPAPSGSQDAGSAQEPAWLRSVPRGPGPSVPDRFRPGFDPAVDELPEPRRGGRVVVHVASLPRTVNYVLDNSATTRRLMYELHEFLLRRDWETWEPVPVLAESWVVEDAVLLRGGPRPGEDGLLFGRVTEEEGVVRVAPVSARNPLAEPVEVPAAEVEAVHPGTVFTFELRRDVRWHDDHPFDARDVAFSTGLWSNPDVDCDHLRASFLKIARCEVLDDHAVRFTFHRPYFLATENFGKLTILPAHRYDLSDPDNPDHDPEAPAPDPRRQAEYVNRHPGNTAWVGLGPYRMTEWTEGYVEAERFPGYFDPDDAGWVDAIRWRHIPGHAAMKQALLNGELDYSERLSSSDYFGEFTSEPTFTERLYKGLCMSTQVVYMAWNTRRAKFADVRVRQALAHAFDWDEYLENLCYGLGVRVTGAQYYFSPGYDRSIAPIPFDLERAAELLDEAGWYDRDGDGLRDRDGEPLSIAFLVSTNNVGARIQAQRLQENLRELGVGLEVVSREWTEMLERVYARDFDAVGLSWVNEVEGDYEQLWHSRWADAQGSNHSGLADPEVDALVEAIQGELDPAPRAELFRKLQRRLHNLQPVMFGITQPKRFAVSRRLRNFRTYCIDPQVRIRDWWIEEDE